MGSIGGADRTFACKSQECLWQDWYICFIIFNMTHKYKLRSQDSIRKEKQVGSHQHQVASLTPEIII